MDLAMPLSTVSSRASHVSRRGTFSSSTVVCSASCHQACEKSVFWQGRALQYIEVVYRIADLVWRNVLQCDRKMDQIKINVTQPPCFVLRFGLRQSVLLAVVVVPKLGDDEDIFTLDESFVDGSLDALSCFFFVLVVVGAIEETVAYFDGLGQISLRIPETMFECLDSRCRQYQQLGRRVLSKVRSLREACHGQRPA